MNETIELFSQGAVGKAELLKHDKKKYLISSMLAGAFIGIGVLTSFGAATVFDAVDSPVTKIAMSLAFCIALTLVLFTGTELFTGNNFVMTIGKLNKKVSSSDMFSVWFYSWVGNFLGAIVLALIFVATGAVSKGPTMEFFSKMALAKATIPAFQLFAKAILCNFLVCIAIVVTSRTQNDAAKIILVIMCLFAFIISGFEHSIANMTVFSIAIFAKTITSITISQALTSLVIATLGNMVGGIFFVGYAFFALKK